MTHERTVLITGASSGLGEHFARLLAEAGYKVGLVARRKERIDQFIETLGPLASNCASAAMDVTDEASVASAFDQIENQLGPINTVIANAGVSASGRTTDMSLADFEWLMDVNLKGVFLTTREAGQRMLARDPKSGDNRIVLIASIGALEPIKGAAAYSASKAGVAMMGQALASEWVNRGINVNVVCPGYVKTDLNNDWFESEAGLKQMNSFPRRRLMQASHMDGIIRFLCGPESDGVTGSVFKVDDGQTL